MIQQAVQSIPQGTAGTVATGAVLVIGGGIAGIQAALDLAESGQKVYLVEKSPAIGGNMARLDKTFPTNDCSMCILSPKLVECGRHRNVELITLAEVIGLSGTAGHFTARIRRKARYVDVEKCTGCGACLEKCPVRAQRRVPLGEIPPKTPPKGSPFDPDVAKHRAIYRPFAQSLPNAPCIDPALCLYLTKGRCRACEKVCEAKAIHYDDRDVEQDLAVGAVIAAPGYEEFIPGENLELGYRRFPDVVTSLEFERILSASGPCAGHVMRVSDGTVPKRLAFLQCVGSRDLGCRHGYCSSVCCMYAVKQAVIAKEHVKGIEATVFLMDLRAFGKDFDRYCERAQAQYGVRFVRGRAYDVVAADAGDAAGALRVRYASEAGGVSDEVFDMVVLSVGLQPGAGLRGLARVLGVRVDEFGFLRTGWQAPAATSRPGVFVAGVAAGPKDIPETVVQASAAACEAGRLLAAARDTRTSERTFPAEKDVTAEVPRIGVFVCHCGINIAGVVDVKSVAEYARSLPGVVYTEDILYACSQDAQVHLRDVILAHGLNRVVVASCSPRTHEPLFQQTMREAGLNPYYFEMANIRDQCSWIHAEQPAEATVKSRDLVRMAVRKVSLAEPLRAASLNVTQSALVIGGGLAGMTAALGIADQGYDVTLVEREGRLGGNLHHLHWLLDEPDMAARRRQLCERVQGHAHIRVLTGSTLSRADGYVGNFESTVATPAGEQKVKHGVIVVATGGRESKPSAYLYGSDRRVLTQQEFEARLAGGSGLAGVGSLVMIQCVGSREPGHPYCSRVCCNTAVKNALRVKQLSPDTQIHILYRDVRTYGLNEDYYRQARQKGILFVRYDLERKPTVAGGKTLRVEVRDPITGQDVVLNPDLVVLSARIEINAGSDVLQKMLKVPLNADGYFLEAHVKLRPVEFATEGVFVAGLAHSPKNVPETIAQAEAAAARAVTIISKPQYEAEPTIAALNEDLCDGCGVCVPVCEYNALEIVARPGGPEGAKIVRLNEAMCKGCGACVAACPSGAMEQKGYKNSQILAMIAAALEE
ncbi:MAG: putative glutamate synthase (NADPH) small subunit [Lentisphaerae bacterium ADurb.BinA184]|nr:MAG: putative glutamate synthase (NADPH) small subunit [Lentisphaerae bacterium ADurb.BinA184]